MRSKKAFVLLFIEILFKIQIALASHFYGGSISSRPLEDHGTLALMEFTIRFAYRRNYDSSTFCNQTTIHSLALFAPSANILCKVGCNITGEIIGTTSEYCSSFSEQNNWSYGYKSFVIELQ